MNKTMEATFASYTDGRDVVSFITQELQRNRLINHSSMRRGFFNEAGFLRTHKHLI